MNSLENQPPLTQLKQIRDHNETNKKLLAKRGKLICQARKQGHTWNQITQAAGITRQVATLYAKQANRGKLPPGNPRFKTGTHDKQKPQTCT